MWRNLCGDYKLKIDSDKDYTKLMCCIKNPYPQFLLTVELLVENSFSLVTCFSSF